MAGLDAIGGLSNLNDSDCWLQQAPSNTYVHIHIYLMGMRGASGLHSHLVSLCPHSAFTQTALVVR